MTPEAKQRDQDRRLILEHLDTWEANQLLTPQEVRAIREFEGRPPASARRVPLITEVVGYLGAALAVAAGVALVAPRWDQIGHVQRVVGAGAVSALTLVAGWLVRKNAEPAIERLAGVLWTLSVAAVAGFTALLVFDVPAGDERVHWAGFFVGVTVAVYARVLHVLRPCAPLLLALFAGTLGALGGAAAWMVEAGWTWPSDNEWWFGVAMLVFSLLWIVAAKTGVLEPRNAALLIGSISAIWAPMFASPWQGFALLLGVATAIAMLVMSVALHRTEMLVLGALGLFVYLVGAIVYFLEDSVGLPIALLLSGLVLVGIAIGTARLRRFTAEEHPAR